jgi:hypothetical protein
MAWSNTHTWHLGQFPDFDIDRVIQKAMPKPLGNWEKGEAFTWSLYFFQLPLNLLFEKNL